MKRNRLLALSTLMVFSFMFLQSWKTGYTGAQVSSNPTTTGCASGNCHGTAVNDQTNLFVVVRDANNAPITTYTPLASYKVEITMLKQNGVTLKKGGFQSIITNISGTAVGTMDGTDMPANVQQVASTPAYMSHNTSDLTAITNASNLVTWSYKWIAPAAGNGALNVHAIVNDADGNNVASGDVIRFNNFQMTEGSSIGVKDLSQEIKAIYPNPTYNNLWIAMNSNAKTDVKIYSSLGQIVFNQSFKQEKFNLDLNGLSSGSYFIHLTQNNKVAKRSFVKF